MQQILGNSDENNRPIQDEVVRTNIKVISARLCDLRERFLKVIQKINRDAAFFDRNLSDEEDEDEDEEEEEEKPRPSDEEMSIDRSETGIFVFVFFFRHRNFVCSDLSSDEENNEPFVFTSKKEQALFEEIFERKVRQHAYLEHLNEYPKILRYIVKNDRKSSQLIPLRHVEPFIIAHVCRKRFLFV